MRQLPMPWVTQVMARAVDVEEEDIWTIGIVGNTTETIIIIMGD
jgi:hypothetical protein